MVILTFIQFYDESFWTLFCLFDTIAKYISKITYLVKTDSVLLMNIYCSKNIILEYYSKNIILRILF